MSQANILETHNPTKELLSQFQEKDRGYDRLKNTNRLLRAHVPKRIREEVEKGNSLEASLKSAQGGVAFIDLSNFTGLSDSLENSELIKLVQSFFSTGINTFSRHNIDIDKFFGDAMLCTGDKEDMLRALPEIVYNLRKRGINYTGGVGLGDYHLGLIGDGERLETLTFGNAVSLAESNERKTEINQILTPSGIIKEEKRIDLKEGTLLDDDIEAEEQTSYDRAERIVKKILRERGQRLPSEILIGTSLDGVIRKHNILYINRFIGENKTELMERLEKERIELSKQNKEFKKFVSSGLLRQIEETPLGAKFVGLYVQPATVLMIEYPIEKQNPSPHESFEHMQELFIPVREIVENARGDVDKILNTQSIMCSFGKSIDSQHHREEAQRTALELIKYFPKIRISIDSGKIIAGSVGAEERQEYTVTGPAVNQTARGLYGSIEIGEEGLDKSRGVVKKGQILVGRRTKRDNFIYLREISSLFKGKDEPQTLNELIGENKNFLGGRYQGQPLIGRDKELEEILDILESPHILGITGHAGIGKSRLSYEVEERAKEYEYKIYHTVCLERDKERPFSGLFGWTRNIDGKFSKSVTGESILRGLSKSEISDGLIEELSDFFLSKVRNGEKVIVQARDTHNMDSESKNVFREVAKKIKDKVTIWYNSRPEPSLIPNGKIITLKELDSHGTKDYIKYLVEERGERYDEDKAENIWKKSGGIPLYIEEFTKYSLEGLSGELPEKIEDVVSERVSSLGRSSKDIAEILSVLGSGPLEKAEKVLEKIVKTDISNGILGLTRKELWENHQGNLIPHHIKTSEIIYGRIESSRREGLHYKVAVALEEIIPEGSENRNRELAYHFGEVLGRRERESEEERNLRWKSADLELITKASHYKEQFGLELIKQPVEREHGISELWDAYLLSDDFRVRAKILNEIQKVGMYLDEGGILPSTIEEFAKIVKELRFGNGRGERRGEEKDAIKGRRRELGVEKQQINTEDAEQILEDIKLERLYNRVAVGFELSRRGNYEGALGYFNSLEEEITSQEDNELLFGWFRRRAVCIADVTRDMIADKRFDEAEELCLPEMERTLEIAKKIGVKDDIKKAELWRATGIIYKKLEDIYLNQSKLIKEDSDESKIEIEKLLRKARTNRDNAINYYEREREVLERVEDQKRLVKNSISLGWAYYFVDDIKYFKKAEKVVNEGLEVASELRLNRLKYDLINLKKTILGEYLIIEATTEGDPLKYAHQLEETAREVMMYEVIQVANKRIPSENKEDWRKRKDKISAIMYGAMRFRAMALYYLGEKEKSERIYNKVLDREKRLDGYQFTASLREYEKDKLKFEIYRIQEL